MKSRVRKVCQGKMILFCLIQLFFLPLYSQEKGSDSNTREKKNPLPLVKPGQGHHLIVPADKSWIDTGLDVIEEQELTFRAKGGISLQKGNPIAYCDSEGYPLKTVQQPLKNENLGALIGKVVKLVSIEIDEETGEEIRHEIEEMFYIGQERKITIPLSGRLFLGINELVVGDNVGSFQVEIRAGW